MESTMRYRLLLTFSIFATPGAASAADSLRERGDLVLQARAILKKYCSECHGAKSGSFDVLDYSQITEKRPIPFVNLDKLERSQIIEFIEDGSMPPGGRARPSDGEIAVLKNWMAEKAPRFFKKYDDPTVMQAVFDDWEKQKSPGNFRYISLAHRVDDGSEFKSLESEQLCLQTALAASTTPDHSVELKPVDEAATVFRIDIEKLGWTARDLFWEVGLKGEDTTIHERMIPYDLILLENPYPLVPQVRFEKFLGSPRHVRPAPFLRGDWLAEVLAPDSPMAADMKSLVELDATLKKGGETPCGPKVRAFEKPKKVSPSGAVVPITSWYGSERRDPFFKLDFKIDGSESPSVVVNTALQLEVGSDRDVRFRLFNVLSDGAIRVQGVGIGGEVLNKGDKRELRTALGMPFKIAGIITGAESATEHFILLAAVDDVPMPTIVHSNHATLGCKSSGPVWRMLFDDKFDSSKAVRKIVTVHVTRK